VNIKGIFKLNCLKYAHQKGPCAKHGKRRRKGTNSHTSVFIHRLQAYFFFFERSFLLFFLELLSVGDKMHLAGQHADLVI